MSSLQKQLAALAKKTPRPVGVGLRQKIRRVSILFTEKEAATIDLQTLHSIGVNGLLELKKFDARFGTFESNLFAPASVELDRELQTEDVNRKLDKTIEHFLLLLSPFMLLKPAHKAFEYLLRRHRYDLDLSLSLSCSISISSLA